MTQQTHRQALPKGCMLQEYQVGRVLGTGGFGLTYLGWDTALDKAVAIKEYLPNDLAVREADYSVAAKSRDGEDNFRWGLARVLDEARTLARFKHPNIVLGHRYFEAHGTAYIVMEFVEGETFGAYLKRTGAPKESFLRAVITALLDGLAEVHRAGFMHRDIKPGNIILNTEGAPVLVDFGSARQEIGGRSRSITSVVTPGYAPIEQYSSRGKQGPWTDIYALGAVAYRAITGNAPPDATERVIDDSIKPAVDAGRGNYSPTFLRVVDHALAVNSKDRLQDVGAWRKVLASDAFAKKPAASKSESKPKQNGQREERWADGTVATGRYVNGKRRGHWVLRFANGGVWEGPYVNHKPHGRWVKRFADGTVQKGSYVDGYRHGQWVKRNANGVVVERKFYENGKLVAGKPDSDPKQDDQREERWVDGTVATSRYVDGKRRRWLLRFADGDVQEGSYKDGQWVPRWRIDGKTAAQQTHRPMWWHGGARDPKPKIAAQQTKISMIYGKVMTIGFLVSLPALLALVIYLKWGVAGLSVAVLFVVWVVAWTQKELAKNPVRGESLGFFVVAMMQSYYEDGPKPQSLRRIDGRMLRAFWHVAGCMLAIWRSLFLLMLYFAFVFAFIFIAAWVE